MKCETCAHDDDDHEEAPGAKSYESRPCGVLGCDCGELIIDPTPWEFNSEESGALDEAHRMQEARKLK